MKFQSQKDYIQNLETGDKAYILSPSAQRRVINWLEDQEAEIARLSKPVTPTDWRGAHYKHQGYAT